MSAIVSEYMPWQQGEERMHRLTKVPRRENPTSPFLTPGGANLLQGAPLLALGTLDSNGRPWATIWGGEAPLAQPVAESIIGIRTTVDRKYDPVIEELFGGKDNGEIIREEGVGRMISGLGLDLEKRRRWKYFGRMIAGALDRKDDQSLPANASPGEVQLVVKIEQSLGNCPKYLNCRHIRPALPDPKLISASIPLPERALNLLAQADTFFISSADHDRDMDMNIRGGPPGFVRVQSNTESDAALVWPEYSGNNLYQTLGNLQAYPRAGVVVPDFETGGVLYLTGETEVLIGKDAASVLPRSNLAVKFTIYASRFVEAGLPFRGEPLERSPYNPGVRYLASEKTIPEAQKTEASGLRAKLIKKETLTPTIFRYRFSIQGPEKDIKWTPGQYAALSFYDELYMGYSHMRDDDPKSLNDDYIRTWTISSHHGEGLHGEEFEMIIRSVGSVTDYLSRQTEGSDLELPLNGFGGDFILQQKEHGILPFVAGGIGITPFIAQLPGLDISRVRLFWTLSVQDLGLVLDTFKHFPSLAECTTLFITGASSLTNLRTEEKTNINEIAATNVRYHCRRLQADDLSSTVAADWYLCTGPALRATILGWLAGKNVVYEDFSY